MDVFLIVTKVLYCIPVEEIMEFTVASGSNVTLLHHRFSSLLTKTSHSITQLTAGSKNIRVNDVKIEPEPAVAHRLGPCAAYWGLA